MRRLARTVAVAAALTLAVALPAAAAPLAYPVRAHDWLPTPGPPQPSAPSWILYDETAGVVLASHAPDEARSMASITKIMTGLLTLELADLDDMVTVSARAESTGEKEIGLVAGERVSVGALFKALLIHSANDAATALAEHISGSVEEFADLMNQRAEQLGMTRTRFANPHGLDAQGHHSSAQDMLLLAREAMAHPAFRDVVRSKVLVFPDAPDGQRRFGSTTNLLLDGYHGVLGVKTGFTGRALLTMVGSAERDGRTLYAVVLGSDGVRGHFADVSMLFDYGFDRLSIYGTLLAAGEGPLTPVAEAAAIEALVHLAGQGLAADLPPPASVEPPQPPVINRHPETPPEGPLEAMVFWWHRLVGSG